MRKLHQRTCVKKGAVCAGAALLVGALVTGNAETRAGGEEKTKMGRTSDSRTAASTPASTLSEGEGSVSINRMRQRHAGHVTLIYSPESESVVSDIVQYAAKCNQRLAQWFQPASPVAQKVHWMARKDWRKKPETYGFPYAGGSDVYLPASDADLPTQLVDCFGSELRA